MNILQKLKNAKDFSLNFKSLKGKFQNGQNGLICFAQEVDNTTNETSNWFFFGILFNSTFPDLQYKLIDNKILTEELGNVFQVYSVTDEFGEDLSDINFDENMINLPINSSTKCILSNSSDFNNDILGTPEEYINTDLKYIEIYQIIDTNLTLVNTFTYDSSNNSSNFSVMFAVIILLILVYILYKYKNNNQTLKITAIV